MKHIERPLGLFLGGGGALGSWQSGVLKELAASGIGFDVIAGFSIGAINGAAYCFGRVEDLKGLWAVVKPEIILKPALEYHHMPLEIYTQYQRNFLSRLKYMMRNYAAKFTLFSNKPLYKLLENWLHLSRSDFSRKIPYYVISHCVERRMPYIAKFNGTKENKIISFKDAVVASCAIPTIFPPVKIIERGMKKHLIDGGVIGVADINLGLFEGCKTIIIISNSRPEDYTWSATGIRGHFESEARKMLFTHMRKIYDSRVFIKSKPQVYLLYPPEKLNMGILEFDGEKCLDAFEMGEKTARKWLEGE